jgi:3-oxoacyl-[acyl-carrier-protein] synthase-1/3-oxoacyl-[acyl-carrier-protein] synthase II
MSAAIVAFGAISALGKGAQAVAAGEPGKPARVVLTRDDELSRAGLERPFAGRAKLQESTEDRASALLNEAALGCAAELDRVLPEWRSLRMGLALGTSSGGLRSAEILFSCRRGIGFAHVDPSDVERAFYYGPVVSPARALGGPFEPATLVLGACAASTLAIGLGTRWLEERRCDLVLAGGFDAVATFVAAGFEVLRATTREPPPRPFRVGRDGMVLGEGAALLAMVRATPASSARAFVTGFGASSDAVHLTAPDRTGAGLARAALAALAEAGDPLVDLVGAHATATPFSDAAESRAIKRVLGDAAGATVVVHPFKAQIGHTLGAAGALESLACVDALERGVLPGAAGLGATDPDTTVRLLDVGQAGSPRTALKLSAAFGGANAALVLSCDSGARPAHAGRPVYVSEAFHLDRGPDETALAAELHQPVSRIARADLLTRLALGAVARLRCAKGPLSGAGVIVGEAFATLETDALFQERILDRGVRMAEPRRFPYTSPNAAAGECSVMFGLTGPSFALGSGIHAAIEALTVARDLVSSGDADRVVVVAADEVGPTVRAMCQRIGVAATTGAVAALVSSNLDGAAFRFEEARIVMGATHSGPSTASGHQALLPLVEPGSSPLVLEATWLSVARASGGAPAWGAWGRVSLTPVSLTRKGEAP